MNEPKRVYDVIETITIKSQNRSLEERFLLIKEIYEKFLVDDVLWHFIFEDEVGDIIRCQGDNATPIINFLLSKDIEYEHLPYWEENLDIVKTNTELFLRIFTDISETIISREEPYTSLELAAIFDRFCHIFYLGSYLSGSKLSDESYIIARTSLDRAKYEGVRAWYGEYIRNRGTSGDSEG